MPRFNQNAESKSEKTVIYICAGGGGGYAGGDTYKAVMNGDGGNSYIGSKRSIADLSFIYAGDNIGHGSVAIVPALPHPACGCDYRCVVLDEFSVNVRCICPEGWRLKKDNLTACERKCQKLCKTLFKPKAEPISLIQFTNLHFFPLSLSSSSSCSFCSNLPTGNPNGIFDYILCRCHDTFDCRFGCIDFHTL